MDKPASNPAPVQNFSDCHAGIVAMMRDLGELPALLEAERRAERIRGRLKDFYRSVILGHHAEEEEELFPAVLIAAQAGEERAGVESLVARLTAEHRRIESQFARLVPAIQATASRHPSTVDAAALAALVNDYLAHAKFEEDEFLPLATRILERQGSHMAALAASLHMRHSIDEVKKKFGYI